MPMPLSMPADRLRVRSLILGPALLSLALAAAIFGTTPYAASATLDAGEPFLVCDPDGGPLCTWESQ